MGSGNSSGASAWGLVLLLPVDELRNPPSDASEDALKMVLGISNELLHGKLSEYV